MSASRRKALLALALALLCLAPAAARGLGLDVGSRIAIGMGAMGIGLLLVASTLWWAGDLCDSAPAALRRRYVREFLPPMVGYAAVMLFWKRWLLAVDAAWLRVLVALLPAVFVLLALRSIMRYVRDSDEMQRRIELESIAIATGLTCAAFLTAGFLQSAKLIAVPATAAMLMVFPAVCAGYGIAKIFVARRYA